jgi:hypothetical protein
MSILRVGRALLLLGLALWVLLILTAAGLVTGFTAAVWFAMEIS